MPADRVIDYAAIRKKVVRVLRKEGLTVDKFNLQFQDDVTRADIPFQLTVSGLQTKTQGELANLAADNDVP